MLENIFFIHHIPPVLPSTQFNNFHDCKTGDQFQGKGMSINGNMHPVKDGC